MYVPALRHRSADLLSLETPPGRARSPHVGHGHHRYGLPRPACGPYALPVRAIQVDGGSEFQAVFEEACQARGIPLFVLPPRSPKLNECVERAQRTHTEEFYEVTPFSLETAP